MLALLPTSCPGNTLLSGSECSSQDSFGSVAKKRQRTQRSVPSSALKTHRRSDSEEQEPAAPSRRQIMLHSWNYAVLGTALSGSNDATTIVNSILGMSHATFIGWDCTNVRFFRFAHVTLLLPCSRSLWSAKVERIQWLPRV